MQKTDLKCQLLLSLPLLLSRWAVPSLLPLEECAQTLVPRAEIAVGAVNRLLDPRWQLPQAR